MSKQELRKEADSAWRRYDRASRSIAANDAECSVLYHEYMAAEKAWQEAK